MSSISESDYNSNEVYSDYDSNQETETETESNIEYTEESEQEIDLVENNIDDSNILNIGEVLEKIINFMVYFPDEIKNTEKFNKFTEDVGIFTDNVIGTNTNINIFDLFINRCLLNSNENYPEIFELILNFKGIENNPFLYNINDNNFLKKVTNNELLITIFNSYWFTRNCNQILTTIDKSGLSFFS